MTETSAITLNNEDWKMLASLYQGAQMMSSHFMISASEFERANRLRSLGLVDIWTAHSFPAWRINKLGVEALIGKKEKDT